VVGPGGDLNFLRSFEQTPSSAWAPIVHYRPAAPSYIHLYVCLGPACQFPLSHVCTSPASCFWTPPLSSTQMSLTKVPGRGGSNTLRCHRVHNLQ